MTLEGLTVLPYALVNDVHRRGKTMAHIATSNRVLSDVLHLNARRFSNRVAVAAENGKSLRYGDLARHLETIAEKLRCAGIGCDDRVAVAFPHGLEAVAAIVGAICSAVAVPIDPQLTVVEAGQRFDQLKIGALIVPPGSSSARAAAESRNLAVFTLEIRAHDDFDFIWNGRPVPTKPNKLQEAVAYILPTSGTTGTQKFVPFSHRNQLNLAMRVQNCFDLKPEDCCLCLSPAFYSFGLAVGILPSLLVGSSVVLPHDLTKLDFAQLTRDAKPTWCLGGPTILRAMSEQAKRRLDHIPEFRLRFLVSGGAVLSPEVRTVVEAAVGAPILEHYGLTETGMMATNRLEHHLRKPGTCGKAPEGLISVRRPDGELQGPGEMGEIWVRGPTLTSGYLEDPEANALAFADGWFRTGDLGSLDADGFLTVRGRLKEVINRGGEKIVPSEIDAALESHPAIVEAAAFGLPHPRTGEQVGAAVVVRKGEAVTGPELRRWLASTLARHKIPRRIMVVDRLPRSRTGKILRHELTNLTATANSFARASAPERREHGMSEAELGDLWQELLGRKQPVAGDEDFFEVGGDSILAAQMIVELERLLGIPLSDDLLYSASTPRDLAAKLATFVALERPPLIAVQDRGEQPPLFFCHGNYQGGGYYTLRFARLLGAEQPFYALPPPFLGGNEPLPSMEQIASERVPLLLAKQRQGRFRLGGYCNGALLAFEMARQLLKAGREVELVIMLDPPGFNARPHFQLSCQALAIVLRWIGLETARRERALTLYSTRLGTIFGIADQFTRSKSADRASMLARPFTRIIKAMQSKEDHVSSSDKAPKLTGFGERYRALDPRCDLDRRWHQVVTRYMPSRLDTNLLVFAAAHGGHPWRRFCNHFELVNLPPDHVGCVTSYLDQVALTVSDRLKGNWRTPRTNVEAVRSSHSARAAAGLCAVPLPRDLAPCLNCLFL